MNGPGRWAGGHRAHSLGPAQPARVRTAARARGGGHQKRIAAVAAREVSPVSGSLHRDRQRPALPSVQTRRGGAP